MPDAHRHDELRSDPLRRAVDAIRAAGAVHLPMGERSQRVNGSHVGVAHATFSGEHPSRFPVMFAPDLIDGHDPAPATARQRAFAILHSGVDSLDGGAPSDAAAAVPVGWTLVQGPATLAATGIFDTAMVQSLLSEADLSAISRWAEALLNGAPRTVRS